MLFYRALYPIWFASMVAVSPFVAKVRRGLRGRRGMALRVQGAVEGWSVRPYWFHFASSGEFEQAIPIVDALRASEPDCRIFLSYFSPTGKRALELEVARRAKAGISVSWDASDYCPLDFYASVSRLLDLLQPKAFVVLNREFWPELLEGCYRREIPVFVFAVYFSPGARRAVRFYRSWLRRATFLGTTDLSTAEFLRQDLKACAIEPLGDPRIERVLERRRLPPDGLSLEVAPGAPVFIGASLWPQDFESLQSSLGFLFQKRDWQVFLVPHEPDEGFLRVLESWLENQNIPYVRWSKRKSGETPRVVLVDAVGWLAELYRHATIAFVGGGFRARVHNVLEPAAYGLPILTGPAIQNSHEAVEMSRGAGGLFAAADAQGLLAFVERMVEDSAFRLGQGKLALQYVEQRRGAGKRYSDQLSRAVCSSVSDGAK